VFGNQSSNIEEAVERNDVYTDRANNIVLVDTFYPLDEQ
jgi:hypothetical protein